MAIVDHANRSEILGPTSSTVKRSRFFSGALVTRAGLANQLVASGVGTPIEFNTELYDIGDWFDNSTAVLRARLTVPGGISFVRFFTTLHFTPPTPPQVNWTNVFFNVIQNDILISSFGRANVAPIVTVAAINIESVTTAPIPCVPGDYFGISISGFGGGTTVLNNTTSVFGIEAVVGG